MSADVTTAPPRDVDFGCSTAVLRAGPVAWLLRTRLLLVSGGLVLIAIGMALLALQLGDYPLSTGEVIQTLLGGGEGFTRTVVLEWRVPIALAALLFGALLGIGGGIFQSLTRNPLGSPDIIGFDAGSYSAVLVTVLVIGTRSYQALAVAAICGGLATAMVVYLLAYRRGIQGFRLIIVGIGVAAVLGSINAYLITRAEVDDAMAVAFWGAGSIARVTWGAMVPSMVLFVVIVAAAACFAPALHRLDLGDDAATTLGTRVGAMRLVLVILGVSTTAVVTAAAGPLGFIALVAPQLARRVTGSAGISLLAAAAMGAALLTAAHLLTLLLAMVLRPLPVGLVTVCLGGCYLIWLLIRESRRHYGAIR